MKKLTLFTVALAFFATLSIAQNDCSPFLPMEEGTTWELTNYSAKGKVEGINRYELLSVDEDGDDIIFTVRTTSLDKNEKEVFVSEFEAYCRDGEFSYDMSFMMDGQAMQAYESMEVDVDGSEYTLPDLDAPAGTELPDANLRIAVQGPIVINMTVDITDRSIDAREEVTTPAGSFDCVAVSQVVKTKTIMKIEVSSKEWYAPGVGIVRTESYNRKGKMTGYSELTALDQ
ncbi:MAG: hypothetical protein AAFP77_07375 [Bacteroidota bacterium]